MTPAYAQRAVLLVTMGGPRDLSEVKAYLRRVFSDPYIIPGSALKRWFLSRLIARTAAPKSRERYAAIGGKSSAVEDTELLARQVTEHFAFRGIRLKCAVATRYSTPSIEQGLAVLAPFLAGSLGKLPLGTREKLSVDTPTERSGRHPHQPATCEDAGRYEDAMPTDVPVESNRRPITPVYLFPHKTSAMTGSCAHVLGRAAAKRGISVEPGMRHLGTTNAYTRGWADAIERAIHKPADTFVLFSCHSLPLKVIERGDPYVREVRRSVDLIQARLGDLASGLGYQSQEGADWLGPTVRAAAADAYHKGFRELIVAPLSFVGESTETRVDLDRELREAAFSMGFRRVERLSTPDKLGFLCAIVVEALCKEWGLGY
ncbi:MAG: ferrochelatase [Planctomycetota bacterium]